MLIRWPKPCDRSWSLSILTKGFCPQLSEPHPKGSQPLRIGHQDMVRLVVLGKCEGMECGKFDCGMLCALSPSRLFNPFGPGQKFFDVHSPTCGGKKSHNTQNRKTTADILWVGQNGVAVFESQ